MSSRASIARATGSPSSAWYARHHGSPPTTSAVRTSARSGCRRSGRSRWSKANTTAIVLATRSSRSPSRRSRSWRTHAPERHARSHGSRYLRAWMSRASPWNRRLITRATAPRSRCSSCTVRMRRRPATCRRSSRATADSTSRGPRRTSRVRRRGSRPAVSSRFRTCAVPLLDMLRYQNFRIARFWIAEYGSAEDPEQAEWLRKYSPYHNVRAGVRYPAVLFTTAEGDSRVDPMHARKMAALLQAQSEDPESVVLLRVDRDAGHGIGKPLDKQVDDFADQYAFIAWRTGLDLNGPGMLGRR